MSKEHDTTLIILHDFRKDDNPDGNVVIRGRIKSDDLIRLQDFLKGTGETDMDCIEQLARTWLENNEFSVVYPLYWEQVYL